jgi:hypothetical protein
MTIKKFATSAAVMAGLIAASMAPLTTAASAHGSWNKGNGPGYGAHYNNGPRHFHNHGGPRYGNGYGYGYKRHHHGRDVAKGLAIGLGVLAVGSILAHGR